MHPDYQIRLAGPADVALLPDIEDAAGELFESAGIEGDFLAASVALEVHAAAQAEGRLWVATCGQIVVGFALLRFLADGLPHLEEIDVHPDHGRRGLGRALIECIAAWASDRGHESLSLATFRAVAWNAPYYARIGFVTVRALTPALREVVDEEERRGLPTSQRVVMRRPLRG